MNNLWNWIKDNSSIAFELFLLLLWGILVACIALTNSDARVAMIMLYLCYISEKYINIYNRLNK